MDAIAKAQAVMTAWDASMSQARREEERAWHLRLTDCHDEDVEYMQSEAQHLLELSTLRDLKDMWREEDMEQRNLENARALWLRFVERNRRDVEEKSDQLKAISNLAALFCGFATVTLTQFIVEPDNSWVVLGIYGVLTALVEGLMVISMVTCTLILGSIVKMGRLYVNEVAEEEFMFQCRDFCLNFELGNRPPCPKRTLEAFWELRCEKSWQRAFLCFSFGVSAFVCSLIVVGWLKFASKSVVTAGLFTFVSCVSVVIWMVIQYSWGSYTRKRGAGRDRSIRSGNPDGLPFDWYLAPDFRQSNLTTL
ncbi:hypothetical protein M758_2G120200 [Ceratodon purpureus]|nr:hypothetical protein M758_2G120200 [Ceratodon purpureus]